MADDGNPLYAWGENNAGNLGTPTQDDMDDDFIVEPRLFGPNDIRQATGGLQHTLLLDTRGRVYACGSNTSHQLGMEVAEEEVHTPVSIHEAEFGGEVICIAAGEDHSVAVNARGEVFCWGLNNFNQSGVLYDRNTVARPTKVPLKCRVVQVAAGSHHTLALSTEGNVYSWGLNNHGQLGQGNAKLSTGPTLVRQLFHLPVVQVRSCGHVCAAVTRRGSVYTWGRPTQLVMGEVRPALAPPQPVGAILGHAINSVALTAYAMFGLDVKGNVWMWGVGRAPTCLMELMGCGITSVVCGGNHTLLCDGRRVLELPISSGCDAPEKVAPVEVKGPWGSSPARCLDCELSKVVILETEESMVVEDSSTGGTADTSFTRTKRKVYIRDVFCGTDTRFVCTTNQENFSVDNNRVKEEQPAVFTPMVQCDQRFTPVSSLHLEHLLHLTNPCRERSLDHIVLEQLETCLTSVSCWNNSFLDMSKVLYKDQHAIDVPRLVAFMEALGSLSPPLLERCYKALWDMVSTLSDSTSTRVRWMIFYFPLFNVVGTQGTKLERSLLVVLSKSITNNWQDLTDARRWISNLPLSIMKKVVKCQLSVIRDYLSSNRFSKSRLIFGDIEVVYAFCELIYTENLKRPDGGLDVRNFYLHDLEKALNIIEDLRFSAENQDCPKKTNTDYPFLYDGTCKAKILRKMCQVEMTLTSNRSSTFFHSGYSTYFDPKAGNQLYLELTVRRETENMILDTLEFLITTTYVSKFRLPLRVNFVGEIGEDLGGVRKEFFNLILPALFHPDFGAFESNEESRLLWFAQKTRKSLKFYECVGTLCALVIYNNITIDLPFPLALYKLLLGRRVGLDDLAELDPTTAKSLWNILEDDSEGSVEALDLTFVRGFLFDGKPQNVELLEDGCNKLVSKHNKQDYVDLFVNSVFSKQVSEQYRGFHEGFWKVMKLKERFKIFTFFQADELRNVVAGTEDYNWDEFRENTVYNGLYNRYHNVILQFWAVFNQYSLADKKKFLKFLTACDRVPIEGMMSLRMTIEPTQDLTRLPVAHTCTYQLDLPVYTSADTLKHNLDIAICHHERFDLV